MVFIELVCCPSRQSSIFHSMGFGLAMAELALKYFTGQVLALSKTFVEGVSWIKPSLQYPVLLATSIWFSLPAEGTLWTHRGTLVGWSLLQGRHLGGYHICQTCLRVSGSLVRSYFSFFHKDQVVLHPGPPLPFFFLRWHQHSNSTKT